MIFAGWIHARICSTSKNKINFRRQQTKHIQLFAEPYSSFCVWVGVYCVSVCVIFSKVVVWTFEVVESALPSKLFSPLHAFGRTLGWICICLRQFRTVHQTKKHEPLAQKHRDIATNIKVRQPQVMRMSERAALDVFVWVQNQPHPQQPLYYLGKTPTILCGTSCVREAMKIRT